MTKVPNQFLKSKKRILNQMLVNSINLEFNEKTLIFSANKCNISKGYLRRIFPEGIIDLKKYFFEELDKEMLKKIKKSDYSKFRIRDKIYNGVLVRLEILNKNKEAVKKILANETNNPINSMKHLWKTSDLIWITAGDSSTDYNYYTKRLLLSWVYCSTLLCWINDKDLKLSKTKLFLDRRIEEVLKFGKNSGKFKSIINDLSLSEKIINIIQEFKTNKR